MLYALIAIAGITGFLALRTSFPLFRFGAAIPWIALMAYIVGNYSGENWTVIAILGCIVMMVAFPLMQLGRDTRVQKDFRGGLNTETTGNFSFKLPDWLKTTTAGGSEKVTRERRERETEEYRDRLHSALHPPKRGRK